MLNKDLLKKIEVFADENNEAMSEINENIKQINECLAKVNTIYIDDEGVVMLDEEELLTLKQADPTKTFIKKLEKLALKLEDITFYKNTVKKLVWARVGWNEAESRGIYAMAVHTEEHTYGKAQDSEERISLRDCNFGLTSLIGDKGPWHDHIKKLAAPFFNDFMKAILESIQKKTNNVN